MSQRDTVEFNPFVGGEKGGGGGSRLGDLERIVDMHVQGVVVCSVYVFQRFKVFLTLANFTSIVDFSSCV
jgi:hypothetical protein